MSTNARLGPAAMLAALALHASGCAGTIKNMREVAPGSPEPQPAPGKALVVFMRHSGLGFAVQSSVFEIRDQRPELVGIVAAKAKVAWQADPGQHLFMAVGESGEFMSAQLLPGKTYFAIVAPSMGMWKARFSLEPVSREKLGSAEFAEWLAECRWVEKEPASDEWARQKLPEIQAKYAEYHPAWTSMPEAERPRLRAEDGK